MSSPLRVPLQPTNQRFTITLVGVVYTMTIRWNGACQAWILDLGDASNNLLIAGLPLVTGVDLLSPFAYLNIGGQLIVQTTNDTPAVPTLANLGLAGNLYFIANA
jgi:hypothetical protein